ncbi:helix-hairpin-helix domain-containing protein [Polaribacter sp. R2A056_3_33]|uniref:ComEA family DNA-binding protein n=1 Tax=Polaribacter sp. R2A056_3_33 TaxID=2745563 RepID=UPI001C4E791A|nr:helix-hairpin-helix domain-containing protein [Polaribacter sp. R2A056_3_33]QXP69291.1 helix-hairpin-helix domain-containing protein [Polaribacter sp. R2A056_3_33]
MKILKSHFWYHKSQRNGIFFLILLILIMQSVIVFGNFSSDDKIDLNSKQVLAFHEQIDSIRTIEIENRKPKIYPFNPNYITDSKGEQLGMSIEEIDRLLAFRKTNKFVNSKSEFQRVTQISDSLLHKIAPYFKFPDWVVKQNSSPSSSGRKQTYYKKNEKIVSTTDINKATAQDFRTISGVGAAFSERIINYRTKLQGFSIEDQLKEVWGLDVEVANKVLSKFKIVDKPIINKINVNTASFKALLKNPYIDYSLCKKIFEYRDEVAELQNISELKNIIDFPLDKYDRIVLYLMAE